MIDYLEYLVQLKPKSDRTILIQNDQHTKEGFLYEQEVKKYMATAIEEDLFEVYYQPVYSTEKNDFVTLEALSRLHHPELGWIAPDVFIQIAEKKSYDRTDHRSAVQAHLQVHEGKLRSTQQALEC